MWYLRQPAQGPAKGQACTEETIRGNSHDAAFLGGCCVLPDAGAAVAGASVDAARVAKGLPPEPHPYLLLTQALPAWASPDYKGD